MNAIVVPIYKDFQFLTKNELLSLSQLLYILGKHDIFFATSKSLKVTSYLEHSRSYHVSVRVKKFSNTYFRQVDGYSKLMTSVNFYKRFRKYKHLLVYQLDAYLFKDELDYWCNKGYDYIGAPWTGVSLYNNIPLIGVGNGGFSVRNVSKSIRTIRSLQVLSVLNQYKNLNWKGLIPRLPQFLSKLIAAFTSSKSELGFEGHEDIFWCKFVPSLLNKISFQSYLLKFLANTLIKNDFKIAPIETALQFSFETRPRELYKLNNKNLPFGCHAWEKYDPHFWKAFIPGDYFRLKDV